MTFFALLACALLIDEGYDVYSVRFNGPHATLIGANWQGDGHHGADGILRVVWMSKAAVVLRAEYVRDGDGWAGWYEDVPGRKIKHTLRKSR